MPRGYLILAVDGSDFINDQQFPVSGNLANDMEDKVEEVMMPEQNVHGEYTFYFNQIYKYKPDKIF